MIATICNRKAGIFVKIIIGSGYCLSFQGREVNSLIFYLPYADIFYIVGYTFRRVQGDVWKAKSVWS
jgi:hypothetical protein